MRRFALVFMLAALLVPIRAEALSIRDIIELTRAGLGEDVLLALIEVDRPVFSTDANTLKMLKAAGVSERVIVAMVRSGRTPEAVVAPPVVVEEPQPEPQVIVIDHHDPQPSVTREVMVPVAVPVYIPVGPASRRVRDREDRIDDRRRPDEPVYPVYWGFGGNRRPDAWQEDPRTIRLREQSRKK